MYVLHLIIFFCLIVSLFYIMLRRQFGFLQICSLRYRIFSHYHQQQQNVIASNHLSEQHFFSDESTKETLLSSLKVIPNFITNEEEKQLLQEIEPHLKRLKYESSHWDDAIVRYREVERNRWSGSNEAIFQRVRETAFPNENSMNMLSLVHVLDLAGDGHIKHHVDSVKFCGGTISGISLLSNSIMQLRRSDDHNCWGMFLLPRLSLYIMTGAARYEFSHAILSNETSYLNGVHVPKTRRISIMLRNRA